MGVNVPIIADLFCGAGGAGMGLSRAGFKVIGFDIEPQPNYPFEFHRMDAFDVDLSWFDAAWASPPCQAFSVTRKIHGTEGHDYKDLIAATRFRLEMSGVTFIIENVMPAPIREDIKLCGRMFGLRLLRHRKFESSIPLIAPDHPRHTGTTLSKNTYSCFKNGADYITVGGHNFNRADGNIAMGIDWMTKQELTQAVPPAYAEWIGRRLLAAHRSPGRE